MELEHHFRTPLASLGNFLEISWTEELGEVLQKRGFLGGSVVKNLPANTGDIKTLVQSLDQEDSLEEGMVTHSSILAWRIPWTEELGGLYSP